MPITKYPNRFRKGGTPWNKGLTKDLDERIPQPWLGKKRPDAFGGKRWTRKGIPLSDAHKERLRVVQLSLVTKGIHKKWSGNHVGYNGIHIWLRKKFGRASVCENKSCSQKSRVFQWALLRGRAYLRTRSNFVQLCVSCHRLYDNGRIEL